MTVSQPNVSPLARRRFADTRIGRTVKATINNRYDIYVTVNFFDNHQPGEVFISSSTHGSTVAGLLDSIAVMMSMLLQVGVPLAKVTDKMRHTRFEPRDDNYSSFVDAVAMILLQQTERHGGNASLDHNGQEVAW